MQSMRAWYFPLVCVGMLSGIALFTALSIWVWCIGMIIVVGSAFCGVCFLPQHTKITLCCVVGVYAGCVLSIILTPAIENSREIDEGVVYRVRKQDATQQVVVIKSDSMSIEVRAPGHPSLLVGDRIALSCTAHRPASTDFAYEQYFWSQGMTHQCRVWDVRILEHGTGLSSMFWRGHSHIVNQLMSSVHEPARSLMLSMVFGRDEFITDDLIAQFRATGLTHALVVSGMQMILILNAIEYCCVRVYMRPRTRFVVISVFACAYAFSAGAQASIVRAGLMIAMLMMLRIGGRLRGNALRTCMYVALGMLCVRPYQLLYDIGYELSCSAAVGLVCIAPIIAERMRRWNIPRIVIPHIALSVAAYLMTTPIIVWRFHEISLIGVVANVCLGELFSVATYLACVWTVLCVVLGGHIAPAALCIEYFFRLLIQAVSFFAHIPFAFIHF